MSALWLLLLLQMMLLLLLLPPPCPHLAPAPPPHTRTPHHSALHQASPSHLEGSPSYRPHRLMLLVRLAGVPPVALARGGPLAVAVAAVRDATEAPSMNRVTPLGAEPLGSVVTVSMCHFPSFTSTREGRGGGLGAVAARGWIRGKAGRL